MDTTKRVTLVTLIAKQYLVILQKKKKMTLYNFCKIGFVDQYFLVKVP